ncbi:hypothetical protein CHS0354_039425 [Potamilus streckersoni]|uniref:GH16 domain-containing protein n=1 Tax=Potamilus streckersoni TaxID=2493646 RepID=A0AAE0VME2_9BIVA|nr:hypothetical protein CHS0354_039425 [Potamilus streckersoni]
MDWDNTHIILSVDGQPVLTASTPSEGYYKKGGFTNIWAAGGKDAPFDQYFYLQMNVAVGGTTGFFPDDVQNSGYQKPWTNNDPKAAEKFWAAKDLWYPTWNGDGCAMKVKSVKIWQKE